MQIVSDNPDLEHHLARLHDLVVSNGGFVHEDCIINARGGDLRVDAPRKVAAGDRLLWVPDELLLPVDGFGLHLSGDDICLGTPTADVTSLQVELMEAMAAIYNISGKIRRHRKHFPSRLLRERPEIYRRIVMDIQYKIRAQLPEDSFDLDDFINTRKFGLKDNNEGGKKSVLMPIIDFLNHHQRASGFIHRDGGLGVVRRSPQEGSDECFVSYARMDAQIAFFNYGFVDQNATHTLSVPMTINLPGIVEIKVNRSPAAVRKQPVPEGLKDIHRFVPRISVNAEEKQAGVSSLTIPDAMTPRAMRRVLMAVLVGFVRSVRPEQVHELLLEAERQVIDANRAYYKRLIRYISGLSLSDDLMPIVKDASIMADHQLRILDAYEFNVSQLAS